MYVLKHTHHTHKHQINVRPHRNIEDMYASDYTVGGASEIKYNLYAMCCAIPL